MVDSVSLLRQLIACRSVTPKDDGALDLIQSHLAAAGFTVHRLPAGEVDNLWAVRGAPKLLFAGHVDVVPAGDIAQWTSDPFVAEARDGFLYGRGAADMKSAVAAMTAAATSFASTAKNGGEGAAILLTSDEEGAAKNGTRFVVEWLRDNGAKKIPYCIVGEPTCEKHFGDTYKIGRRGSLTANITVVGKQSHVAYPQHGDNPAHRLINALQSALFSWQKERQKERQKNATKKSTQFPPDSFQIVKVRSGIADNVIPGAATATVNFRYAGEAPLLRRWLESQLNEFAPDYRCEWHYGASPFMGEVDSYLTKTLSAVVREVCARTPAPSTAGGASDGRFLKTICPQVAEFGVMNETIHQVNECVRIEDVRRLTSIYEKLMRAILCDGV